MPRKPKTPNGTEAQGIGAIAGQTYGRGVEQEQLQRVVPMPDQRSDTRQAVAQQAQQVAPAAAQPSFDQILALAQGAGAGAGMLREPTRRPDEPLTAGLPIGPGPGPEALRMPPRERPGVRFLSRLTELTGDPYFAELARRGQT